MNSWASVDVFRAFRMLCRKKISFWGYFTLALPTVNAVTSAFSAYSGVSLLSFMNADQLQISVLVQRGAAGRRETWISSRFRGSPSTSESLS